jgi:hypothetical protein
MTRKVYRTANGKTIDIGALQLRNENVRAVGNMPVNSRGDLLDANNKPIDSRNDQVARQYRKQVGAAQTSQVRSSQRAQADAIKPTEIPTPPEDFEDDFVKPPETLTPAPSSGLAGAMARIHNKQ